MKTSVFDLLIMRSICLAENTTPSVFHYMASTDLFIRQMSSAKLKSESSTSIHAMPTAMMAACQTIHSVNILSNKEATYSALQSHLLIGSVVFSTTLLCELKVLCSLYIAQAKTSQNISKFYYIRCFFLEIKMGGYSP